MKNTVSSPTAQRLKAAGFPQPEPEAGQVWYHKDGRIFITVFNGSEKVDYVPSHAPIICREYKKDFLADQVFFAPTATDILAALFPAEIQFQISAMQVLQMALDPEAAAAAWLEIHEKKAFTPNARIRFNREQTIECYDENGKQNLLVIGKGKEYDAILKDMKATIKTVFGPVEFHLSNDDIVFLEWL